MKEKKMSSNAPLIIMTHDQNNADTMGLVGSIMTTKLYPLLHLKSRDNQS